MRLREFAQATASRCSTEVLSGRYRLDNPLGSGGAADVHRGFDLRLRRPVAVKIFRPDAGFHSQASRYDEAVILARLHHPGLVTAFDAGQHDGRSFLVMQLIEGTTLKDRISKGPLPPGVTAALGADLAQALAHAHQAEIVHRDVKPSNILLDAANRPYLADFGISRLLDATTRTATGTLMGTAAYLSPEQVLGQPVGRPSDVYALGLVLLECLTGRLEYDGGPLEAAIARLHRPPVLPQGLPHQLSSLLREMTALDEQNRPTAGECARTLAALTDTVPVAAELSMPATRLVAGQESPGATDHTHVNPALVRNQAAARSAPARGRTLIASTTVALAAVVATAFAVTGSSAPQDSHRNTTRASGSPTGTPEASGAAGQRKEVTPSATAQPSNHNATVGTRAENEPGLSVPSASPSSVGEPAASPDTYSSTPAASPTTSPEPTTSKTPTTPTTPSNGSTSAATPQAPATTPSQQPPGRAKKTKAAEDNAQ
ncbi:serine/threonine-protein kinase [Streptomyces sp. NBC_01013]|uniref:serine/threonine-protein kinase n=1 Tax=Streptomyces sp. NBC_01013 TaxID=2903718 RepID=UPI00386A5F79|nr:serine/threonine protein kinase [Streptomyces sp. NBC_01013]